jgi:hypothetical protein
MGPHFILDRGNLCGSDIGYGHNVCFGRQWRANLSASSISYRIGRDPCINDLGGWVHCLHNFEGCQCSLRLDRNSFAAELIAENTERWDKAVKLSGAKPD